jgi:hypothetical protein
MLKIDIQVSHPKIAKEFRVPQAKRNFLRFGIKNAKLD